MSFTEAVRTCFSKYVTISGRAPRSEYWWWVLFVVLVNIGLSIIDGAVFGFEEGDAAILGPIFALATFLPSICVAGRRLHDRDMSAWWLLLALIPVIGFLVLVYFYIQKGTDGPNRFGADPLGGGGGSGADFARSSIPHTGG